MNINIKYLIVDLDNTLDSAYTKLPCSQAIELKNMLQSLGIEMIIISNNKFKRVSPYANALNVRFISDAKKHSVKRIKRFLDENRINVEESLFVGDQIFTDRIYVNKLHGRLILTEPLVKKDQFFTRFVRWLDRIIRNRWRKKNLLGETL